MTDHDVDDVTVREFFFALAADEEGAQARRTYCNEVARLTADLSSWLAVDAFLGAGDTTDPQGSAIQPERGRAFVAASIVAQMSSDLIKGSVSLLAEGNEYASAGLVRQLIECEYLFRAFELDFADATKWLDSPESAKYDFSPSKLRKIGGFAHEEYSDHCEAGGHPRARGRHLLQLDRRISAFGRKDRPDRDVVNATLWMDLALHCERTWRALTSLLRAEHARFETAGRVQAAVANADGAHGVWLSADPLARHVGPVLHFMALDPEMPLREAISTE